MTQFTHSHDHANIDGRRMFHFELTSYRDEKRERSGVSIDIYANDKRDAIKRFVSMFTPTTRFELTDVTDRVEETGHLPNGFPFADCVSVFNG